MQATTQQIERTAHDWSHLAGEPVTVEQIGTSPQHIAPNTATTAAVATQDKRTVWLNTYNESLAQGFDARQAGIFADTELAKMDDV